MEGIDAKTAWELYKKVDAFGKKLENMKSDQDIILKDLQADQKKNHYAMLDAVNDSVKQYGKLMEANLNGFRFEIKGIIDNHEKRITDQEQKEMTTDLRLISVEKHTEDLPLIRDTVSCLDTRTKNFPKVEEAVETLVAAPGNKAIARWKKLLVVAGFMALAVFTTIEGIWINDLMAKNRLVQNEESQLKKELRMELPN
jgi:hypothetical protein